MLCWKKWGFFWNPHEKLSGAGCSAMKSKKKLSVATSRGWKNGDDTVVSAICWQHQGFCAGKTPVLLTSLRPWCQFEALFDETSTNHSHHCVLEIGICCQMLASFGFFCQQCCAVLLPIFNTGHMMFKICIWKLTPLVNSYACFKFASEKQMWLATQHAIRVHYQNLHLKTNLESVSDAILRDGVCASRAASWQQSSVWKNHTTHCRSCEASKCAGPVPEGPVHSCTRPQCFNRAVTQRIPPFELGKYVLTVDSNSELNSNFECDEPCWQPNHPDWKSDTPAWQVMSLVSNRFKGKCTVISTSLWQHIKFSFSVCGLQFFLECCFWCCSHSAGCLQTTPSLLRADADKQPLGMSDLTFQLSRNPTKSMNVDPAYLNFMLFHSQWSEVARNWALFLVSFGLWCFCPRAMPRQCGVPSLEQCFE